MKRPFPATLTLWLVLITTTINLIRLWTSISWAQALNEFQVSTDPRFSAFVGGLWATAGLILFWSLWRNKAWAGKMLVITGAGYTIWYWTERIFLPHPRPNLIFAVIVNLALLVLIIITNILLSREAYEQRIENPEIE